MNWKAEIFLNSRHLKGDTASFKLLKGKPSSPEMKYGSFSSVSLANALCFQSAQEGNRGLMCSEEPSSHFYWHLEDKPTALPTLNSSGSICGGQEDSDHTWLSKPHLQFRSATLRVEGPK
jgi:hypothetical protein